MRLFLFLFSLATIVYSQKPNLKYLDIEECFSSSQTKISSKGTTEEIYKNTDQIYGDFLESYQSKFDDQKGEIIFYKQDNSIYLYITKDNAEQSFLADVFFLDSEIVSVFWKKNPNGSGNILIVLTKTKDSYYSYIVAKRENLIDLENIEIEKVCDWVLFTADELNDSKNYSEFNYKWEEFFKKTKKITFTSSYECTEHYPLESKSSKDIFKKLIYHDYGGRYFRWQEGSIQNLKTEHTDIYVCLASSVEGLPDRILFSFPNGNGVEIDTFLFEQNVTYEDQLELLAVKALEDRWSTINVTYSINGKICNRKFFFNCQGTFYCSIIQADGL